MSHGSGCDCAECTTAFEVKPNPIIMALRFATFAVTNIFGAVGLVRSGNKKLMAAWLAGWGLFLTVPRYLICASCSGYGKMCYSFYLGKYTSKVFPKREKEVPHAGLVLEGLALSTMSMVPALAMRSDRKSLMTYLILQDLVLAQQFFHACRYCGTHSEDEFKKFCPNYRFWNNFK
jgi:hypothetical protein